MARTHVLHFSVAGQRLTELARSLVTEGAWERGLKLLTEGLEGCGYDVAASVLRGTHTFAGVAQASGEGLRLVEEKPELRAEYETALSYAYAGRFRHKDAWYEPYAVVESWGEADARAALRRTGGRILSDWERPQEAIRRFSNERSRSYMDDPDRDISVVMPWAQESDGCLREMTVLCHICAPAPLWWAAPTTPEAGVAAFVAHKGYTLDRRNPPKTHRVSRLETTAALPDEPKAEPPAAGTQLATERDPRILSRYKSTPESKRLVAIARGQDPDESPESRASAEMKEILAYQTRLGRWRTEIKDRADAMEAAVPGSGWLDIANSEGLGIGGDALRVPRAPFVNWCLWRTAGAHLAPTWDPPVCPSGVKLFNDDAFHTDWMVGAGLDPRVAYDERFLQVTTRAKFDVQAELLGFKVAVLAGRGTVVGNVVHPEENTEVPPGSVAVLPNAKPGYEAAVRTARAVIVPVGGELCHLANVAREGGGRIVRVENCLQLYPVGTRVTVDCEQGRVEISDRMVRDLFGPIFEEKTDGCR
jgi:phosphohistidine swiveling domain-containing protein